jgi:hypothetical protein
LGRAHRQQRSDSGLKRGVNLRCEGSGIVFHETEDAGNGAVTFGPLKAIQLQASSESLKYSH